MTTLEHYGIKGMKWGKIKSYDSVGFMPGKIEKNRMKRLAEKLVNAARRVKDLYDFRRR